MRTLAIIAAVVVCMASVALAQQHRWDMKAGQERFQSNSIFTNHPDSATGNVVEAAGSANIYLGKADPDTSLPVFIGPWRKALVVMRIDASNTESDDSTDTWVWYDASYDNVTWTMVDSLLITDTLWKCDLVDSLATIPTTALGGFRGVYIRLRPDPISGMRQDTVGYRPILNASVIYK